MKLRALCLILNFSITLPAFAAITEQQVVKAYTATVSARYIQALAGAIEIQKAVAGLVANPSEAALAHARKVWVAARKSYSLTEVYRFYEGPIDAEGGPEGMINAWPLDEAYIDGVQGDAGAGIIQNPGTYPVLTKELLREMNEKDGEKNISTGYHAIEFLLWGQDFNAHGPGQRHSKDFIPGQTPYAARRAQYLRLTSEILVEDLQSLVSAWNISDRTSYAYKFVAPSEAMNSLRKILMGAGKLAGEELSAERMYVAYDSRQQEDEHSCFSDTTHFDLVYNFYGIRDVLVGPNSEGPLALLDLKNMTLAMQIRKQLKMTEAAMLAIPTPFDQAIVSDTGRARILDAVTALEDLAVMIQEMSKELGAEFK